MQLADLKTGMIVITRNNKVFYVLRNFLNGFSTKNLIWSRGDWLFFDHYNDDLTCHVDYDEDDWLCQKDPTPAEIRNSGRRARYYITTRSAARMRFLKSRSSTTATANGSSPAALVCPSSVCLWRSWPILTSPASPASSLMRHSSSVNHRSNTLFT